MYSEFLEIAGYTRMGVSLEQYMRLEKKYMASEEDKQSFCNRFRKAYDLTVDRAVKEFISHSFSINDLLKFLDGRQSDVWVKTDKFRTEKLNLLIEIF